MKRQCFSVFPIFLDSFKLHLDTEISEEDVKQITARTKAKAQVKVRPHLSELNLIFMCSCLFKFNGQHCVTSRHVHLHHPIPHTNHTQWPSLGTLLCSSPLEKFGPAGQEKDKRPLVLHKALETNWTSLNQTSNSKGAVEEVSPLQLELLSLMGSYRDVYFPESSPLTEGWQVRSAYCLHALNHVLKANSGVLGHNAQTRENQAADKAGGNKAGVEPQDEPRDQGLTRPKVKAPVYLCTLS